MPGFQSWADDKRIKGLVLVVLILTAVALAAYSYYTYQQSKYVFTGPNTISVSGKGEIFAKPDIATFSFSVDAEAMTANEAQEKSATAMNDIVAYLSENGIEEKDVKTSSYNLNPKYRWEQDDTKAVVCGPWGCPPQEGKQVLDGYQVNQTVEVKVRDTAKAGDLISGVGEKGATNISGLTFTIDDDEKLKRDARELAIADARENAQMLADDLGVSLGRMMNYWEDQGGPQPMYYAKEMAMSDAMGRGGGAAPSVPTGENTIASNVTIVYEIR